MQADFPKSVQLAKQQRTADCLSDKVKVDSIGLI